MSIGTTTRTKASRKAKRCSWCGETIQIGQPKVSFRGLEDGEFYTLHQHPECHDAQRRWPFDQDIPDLHVMQRGSTEYRDE
jgi:hypothetical protein